MNRTRLWVLVVSAAVGGAAIVGLATSAGPEAERAATPPPPAAPPPPTLSATVAPVPTEVLEGEALARVLFDLGAPEATVALARDGRDADPSASDSYDLVWIARARGASRQALLGAVAAALSEHVAAAPDGAAMQAALRETLTERSVRLNAITARDMFPATYAVDPDAVMALGAFATAVSSIRIVDFDWLSALATAARDVDPARLTEALATAGGAPEVPLGIESAVHLDAARIAGANDAELDMLLAVHADATEMHTPIEGLQPVMIAMIAELQILNGGFSQLHDNEPTIALSEVAAGYRAIGLDEVAAAVEREDDVTYWERLRAADATHARAQYLRRLLGPVD